ncbi:MAG: hypothetical protein LAT80_15460, partial [Balneolaceae bacterium]|nr:hypothetical protein [Balneolaceae bacterium]
NNQSDWWIKLVGSLAFIFIAILFIDIYTEGQNLIIRALSIGGALVILASVLYHDYRTQYDRFKKRALSMLLSTLVILIMTAVYAIYLNA